jgi:hypothetical protein
MFSPVADFGPGCGIDAMSSGLAFGQGFGEVHLFVGEEMSEQMQIGPRIAEAVGDHLGRQAINEGGSQGLIAALPFMDGVKEEVFVAHESFIAYDGNNVNYKFIKILRNTILRHRPDNQDQREKLYSQAFCRPKALHHDRGWKTDQPV